MRCRFAPACPRRAIWQCQQREPAVANEIPTIDQVRKVVLDGLRQLGLGGVDESSIEESILVRGGYYAGRRYSLGGVSALWLADRGEVWFRTPDGRTLQTPLGEPARNAA
jgi:hypothetical protein